MTTLGVVNPQKWEVTSCPTSGAVIVSASKECALHILGSGGIHATTIMCPNPIKTHAIGFAPAIGKELQLAIVDVEGNSYCLKNSRLTKVDGVRGKCKAAELLAVESWLLLLTNRGVAIVDVQPDGRAAPVWECHGSFIKASASGSLSEMSFAAVGHHKCQVFLNSTFGKGSYGSSSVATPPAATNEKGDSTLDFLPAIPVQCPEASIVDVQWQQLSFTSLLVLFTKKGDQSTILVYSVTKTAGFSGTPSFQCLLSKSITLPDGSVSGMIPIATRDASCAPSKVKLFTYSAKQNIFRTMTTRFSRFSAPIADRGYEVSTSFPPEWGAPVKISALQINRCRRTLLHMTASSEAEMNSKVEAVIQFGQGPIAHVLLDPSQHRFTIEGIFSVGSGCQPAKSSPLPSLPVVVDARPHRTLPVVATLFSNGTVVIHHSRTGAVLATRTIEKADRILQPFSAPPPSDDSQPGHLAKKESLAAIPHKSRLDQFIEAKCPEKMRLKEMLLKAVGGDEEKLLGNLIAKYGPLDRPATPPPTALPPRTPSPQPQTVPLDHLQPIAIFFDAATPTEPFSVTTSSPPRSASPKKTVAPHHITTLVVCFGEAATRGASPAATAISVLHLAGTLQSQLTQLAENIDGVDAEFNALAASSTWLPSQPSLYHLYIPSTFTTKELELRQQGIVAKSMRGATVVHCSPGTMVVEGVAPEAQLHTSLLEDSTTPHWVGVEEKGRVTLVATWCLPQSIKSAIVHDGKEAMHMQPIEFDDKGEIIAVTLGFVPAPAVAIATTSTVSIFLPSTDSATEWTSSVVVCVKMTEDYRGNTEPTATIGSVTFTTNGSLILELVDQAPLLLCQLQGMQPSVASTDFVVSDSSWAVVPLTLTVGEIRTIARSTDFGALVATKAGRLVWLPPDDGIAAAPHSEATAEFGVGAITAHIEGNDWESAVACLAALEHSLCRDHQGDTQQTSPLDVLSPANTITGNVLDCAADLNQQNSTMASICSASIKHLVATQQSTPDATKLDFGDVTATVMSNLAEAIPSMSISGMSPADQMKLAIAVQVIAKHITPIEGSTNASCGIDKAGLPLLFSWKLKALTDRMSGGKNAQLTAASDEDENAPISVPAITWAMLSETQDKLLSELMTVDSHGVMPSTSGPAGIPTSWSALKYSGFALWAKSPLLIKKVVEGLGKTIFTATRTPKQCALWYILAGKVAMLSALCKAVNNSKLEQFFARDFTIEKNRNAASANAFAAVGKGDVLYGAAFFLLAGDASTAVKVLLQRTKDWQLAFLVTRLAAKEELDGAAVNTFLQHLKDADVELSASVKCCMNWRAGAHVDAMKELWDSDAACSHSIIRHALRCTPVLSMREREVLPVRVEAGMLAAAGRRSVAHGVTTAALRHYSQLVSVIVKARDEAKASADGMQGSGADNKPQAPAIVADFNSGQLMFNMNSDSDDDVPMPQVPSAAGSATTSQPTAESTAPTAVDESLLSMWEDETKLFATSYLSNRTHRVLHDKAYIKAVYEEEENTAVAALFNLEEGSDDGCHAHHTNKAEELLKDALLESIAVGQSVRTQRLLSGAAVGGTDVTSLWRLHYQLIALAEKSRLEDHQWALLSAVSYHVLCTVASATQNIPLALALAKETLPLQDIVLVSSEEQGHQRRDFMRYHKAICTLANEASAETHSHWQAALDGDTEATSPSSTPSAGGVEVEPLMTLFALFDAHASRVLRHAIIMRKLPSSHALSSAILISASLTFHDSVDVIDKICTGCTGSGYRDPVPNGVVVQQRKEWAKLLELVTSLDKVNSSNDQEAAARFFYKISRALCGEVLHSTEHLPRQGLHALFDRNVLIKMKDFMESNHGAFTLATMLMPDSTTVRQHTSLDELEYHHALHVATNVSTRGLMVAEASKRGELLKERHELCPPLKGPVFSACIDRSTFDNVAIGMGSSCKMFHGQREVLFAEDDDILAKTLHERNHATSAFACGTDPSVMCSIELDEHPAKILVAHPHLPVFLSGGQGGGITLHQFGNPHASIRIRSNSHRGVLNDAIFSPNGYTYSAVDSSGTVAVWRFAADAASIEPITNLRCFQEARSVCHIGHRTTQIAALGSSLRAHEASHASKIAHVGNTEFSLKLLDTLVARAVLDVRLPSDVDPQHCFFANDSDTLVTIGNNGTVLLYDMRAAKFRSGNVEGNKKSGNLSLYRDSMRVSCAALSPYNPMLAAGNTHGDVSLWSLKDILNHEATGAIPTIGHATSVHAAQPLPHQSRVLGVGGTTTSVSFTPSTVLSTGAVGHVVAMPLIPETVKSMFI